MKIKISLKKITQIVYIFLVIAFYIYNTNLPLTLIPIAGHDDGLFMRLGRSISSAKWLGSFNQFTLMKGSGLPIILAILYWFKIPITIFYSLLIIGVCEYLRRALNRLLNSYYFAGFISIILMWYPGMDAIRILREPLMSWLVILSIAMAISFYVKFEEENYLDLKLILLTGMILGWICIIREEWETIIIPIMLLPISLIYFSKNVKKYSLLRRNKVVILFLLIVASPTALISSTNFLYYGSYIANDFKEVNFVQSMKLLQSIKSVSEKKLTSGVIPVSKDIRKELYELSPSFLEIKKFMDDDGAQLLGWQKPSCDHFPETCGDYGGAWFFWAFRDAVSLAGYYESPKSSSDFYSKLNNEIKELCGSNKLRCDYKISALPDLNKNQWLNVPKQFLLSFKKITLINQPELYNMPSMGDDNSLRNAAKFLHLSNYYLTGNDTNLFSNMKNSVKLENDRNGSFKIKKYMYWLYSKICTLIVFFGFLSFLTYLIIYRSAKLKAFLLTMLWTIVVLRIFLISIASEASLAFVNHQYLAFAGPVVLLVSLISIKFLLNNIKFLSHRTFRS